MAELPSRTRLFVRSSTISDEASNMKYLHQAISLAKSRGYLSYPDVARRTKEAPTWLTTLGNSAGINRLSERVGMPIPEALIEYYSALPLVCFLEFAVDGFLLFEQEMKHSGIPPDRFPIHLQWQRNDYLAILDHPHSGTYMVASLDRPDPQIAHGEPLGPDSEDGWIAEIENAATLNCSFSEWVFENVNAYEKKLDFWEAAIRKVDTDPNERARVGNYSYYRTLPGMQTRLNHESR